MIIDSQDNVVILGIFQYIENMVSLENLDFLEKFVSLKSVDSLEKFVSLKNVDSHENFIYHHIVDSLDYLNAISLKWIPQQLVLQLNSQNYPQFLLQYFQ